MERRSSSPRGCASTHRKRRFITSTAAFCNMCCGNCWRENENAGGDACLSPPAICGSIFQHPLFNIHSAATSTTAAVTTAAGTCGIGSAGHKQDECYGYAYFDHGFHRSLRLCIQSAPAVESSK